MSIQHFSVSETSLHQKQQKNKLREHWQFNYVFPCSECLALVAGCIVVAFFNFIYDCTFILYVFVIFIFMDYYYSPDLLWSESCTSTNWSLPVDTTEISRIKSTMYLEYHLLIKAILHLIYGVMDIILFIGITEKNEILIHFSFYVAIFRTVDQLAWFCTVILMCEFDKGAFFASLALFCYALYASLILYSMLKEMEQKQIAMFATPEPSQATTDEAEDDNDLNDMYLVRAMLTQSQARTPRPSGRVGSSRRVSLQLKPDVYEVKRLDSLLSGSFTSNTSTPSLVL